MKPLTLAETIQRDARYTAYHEIGHAVFALAMGSNSVFAEINRNAGFPDDGLMATVGVCNHDALLGKINNAAMGFAGVIAPYLDSYDELYEDDMYDAIFSDGMLLGTDLASVEALHPSYRYRAFLKAYNTLKEHWPCVVANAEKLLANFNSNQQQCAGIGIFSAKLGGAGLSVPSQHQ